MCVAWNWGHGWLYQIGFHDFAGTTTVHLVGGAAALVGAAILGKRHEKTFGKDKNKHTERHESIDLNTNEFENILA